MNTTDAALFDQWLREKDPESFKILSSRYARMVYGTCKRILRNAADAEDVTQECFIILAATRKPVGAYLAPWLHRVACNRSIVRLRSERRRKEREGQFFSGQRAAADRTWKETAECIDEAISRLPDKFRIPVIAHFLDGKSHNEIAFELGIPRSTVSYRINKGVERIRGALKKEGMAATSGMVVETLKVSAISDVPPCVYANLGKLALSGVDGIAMSAAQGGATLAHGMFAIGIGKTLAGTAAGAALLFFGLRAFFPVSAGDVPAASSASRVESAIVSSSESGAPHPLEGDNETGADEQIEEPSGAGEVEFHTPFPSSTVIQSGTSLLRNISQSAGSAWRDFKRTVNGENARRQACQMNMKNLGLVFRLFTNDEPHHYFPMLNPHAGRLMFINENPGMKPLCPGYMKPADAPIVQRQLGVPGGTPPSEITARALICPNDLAHFQALSREDFVPWEDDYSYYYLGYAIRTLDDLKLFDTAYRERIARGLPFDEDMETSSGVLYRLRDNVERIITEDDGNPGAMALLLSTIVVLIEAPRHDPEGGNILFMDGHVEFRRSDLFPLDAESMSILRALSAMK